MDGKRFKYISAISLLTVWGALGPWLERTGACWLVQQAPWDTEYLIHFLIEKRRQTMPLFPRIVEQTGSPFRNYIFEKALEASITCNLLGICIVRMIPKPSKNGSAFCQKAIKIQAWRHQDRGLEGSGASLEASWASLGDPRRLESHLGPSWRRLGGLDIFFGFSVSFGAKNRAMLDRKCIRTSILS